MSPEQLLQSLQSRQPVLSTRVIDATLNVEVERESLRDLLRILRDELHFDFLTFLTALDRIEENRLAVVYRLFSYATKAAVVVRVSLPRDAARLDTVHDIYRTAEWHERETAEMSGPASGGALMPDPVSPPAATLPSPPTTSDEFLSALHLALTLFIGAALYVMLNAYFLAAIQVLLYIGAVVILAIFVINITRDITGQVIRLKRRWVIPPAIVSALTACLITIALLKTRLPGAVPGAGAAQAAGVDPTAVLGRQLLGDFALPFEIVSVLLLSALIAAITIVGRDSPKEER